jgi:hypothetical protein
MSEASVSSSFWSGMCFFTDPRDDSTWACRLLEAGHDGPAIGFWPGFLMTIGNQGN